MAEFLVEVYVRRDDPRTARTSADRARRAAADLTREGRDVQCVRSIFVPEDETFLVLFEAPSVDAVSEAVGRAGLRCEHISAASSPSPSTSDPGPGRSTPSTEGSSMTQSSPSATLTELRDKQQRVWSSGDYNKIAAITVPVSEFLVEHVGVMPGTRVLDVATGTGHAALAAARRGAVVTGIDYVPALLDIARRRTAAEDLEADFAEADAERLPYDDGSFDVVVSAIGVMFSADHQRAADELVRVTRPGGRIAVASWTPDGFVGGMLAAVGRHVAPPPGAQRPTLWGEEAVVAELLGSAVSDVRSVTTVATQRFTDAEAFADLFLEYYGPTYAAAGRLDPERRAAFRSDLVALAEGFDRGTDSGVVLDWEYRVVTATKRVA
jgi:ubiquinone/menaquinone biosynthesis C-methylase UbiE